MTPHKTPPEFDADFRERLHALMSWRRDVRRFRTEPIPADRLARCLAAADLAPSVGDSRPWRWVAASPDARAAVQASFSRCNADALAAYADERATLYAKLKLEGLRDAPAQFAVFCDRAVARGEGLGRRTMPETLDYSVVAAITTFWLAARAEGIGVGWVSILEPDVVTRALDVPPDWHFVAWLCVGWPVEEHEDPELQRAGWTPAVAQGQATAGGIDDRIDSTLPPVRNPKIVPRS